VSHTLIIGGTRGLGRTVASLMCAEPSSEVSIVGRNPPSNDRELPGNLRYWKADLSDRQSAIGAAVEAIRENGPLNYLLFCQRYRGAGDDWAGEIQVSLTATRDLIDTLTPYFSPDGDKSMVFVGSPYGENVGQGQPLSYHVGKAGLSQMARYYAVSLGRKGIRANVVSPLTYIKEESKDFYIGNQALQSLYEEIVPLSRMGTALDTANLVMFLCSPKSSFISGQNIYVDGGLSLVWPETIARKLMSI
jgi:NAD(P)-dependent dehydrogenase (short-subunit alcohol dehydrogenase family)